MSDVVGGRGFNGQIAGKAAREGTDVLPTDIQDLQNAFQLLHGFVSLDQEYPLLPSQTVVDSQGSGQQNTTVHLAREIGRKSLKWPIYNIKT